jgi:hypothetical protein
VRHYILSLLSSVLAYTTCHSFWVPAIQLDWFLETIFLWALQVLPAVLLDVPVVPRWRYHVVHACLDSLHNEVGPGGPPCAPPYIRRVRICGTLAFLIHSAPDLSPFCDAPPVCVIWANLFPFSHFSFQMTSFPVGFPFSVYTYVVLINFSVLHTL